MKKSLITLHTEDTNALFDNIFNDEIVIEPDTEIAFHSCCLRLDNFRVNINNSNKLVTLQIGATAPIRHLIAPGSYPDNEVQYLLEKIQNDFNQQLNIDNSTDNGQQIRVNLTVKNIVSLIMARAVISQASLKVGADPYIKDTEFFTYGDGINIDGASGVLSRTGSQHIGDGLTEFIHGRIPITKGCGFCAVQVKELRSFNANVPDGAIMMVTEESSPAKHETRTTSLFYVRIPFRVGEVYKYTSKEENYIEIDYTQNGVPVLCQLNDIVQIELSKGTYLLRVYRNGVTFGRHQILSVAASHAAVYNDTEAGDIAPPLYMTVGLIGPTFSGLVSYLPDPFQNTTPKFTLALPDLQDAPPAFPGLSSNDYVLSFQSDDVASSFGFEQRVTTVRSSGLAKFLGTDPIDNSSHPNNFKVEMLNLQLESFDSQKEGRMNILATIPVEKEFKDQQLSILNFQPENMFYLSIRNKTKLSLRNIRARVIDANNNPIKLLGFSSINLLIKSDHE